MSHAHTKWGIQYIQRIPFLIKYDLRPRDSNHRMHPISRGDYHSIVQESQQPGAGLYPSLLTPYPYLHCVPLKHLPV